MENINLTHNKMIKHKCLGVYMTQQEIGALLLGQRCYGKKDEASSEQIKQSNKIIRKGLK